MDLSSANVQACKNVLLCDDAARLSSSKKSANKRTGTNLELRRAIRFDYYSSISRRVHVVLPQIYSTFTCIEACQ
jgi:hypothetical protein